MDIPFAYQARRPLDFTSSLGEHWRLAVYDLQGGKVILGISELDAVSKPDDLLLSTSHTFGNSIQDAVKVQLRQIDINIDYAVIGSDGTLKYANGGVPLRVLSTAPLATGNSPISQQLTLGHKTYQVVAQSIIDRSRNIKQYQVCSCSLHRGQVPNVDGSPDGVYRLGRARTAVKQFQ